MSSHAPTTRNRRLTALTVVAFATVLPLSIGPIPIIGLESHGPATVATPASAGSAAGSVAGSVAVALRPPSAVTEDSGNPRNGFI